MLELFIHEHVLTFTNRSLAEQRFFELTLLRGARRTWNRQPPSVDSNERRLKCARVSTTQTNQRAGGQIAGKAFDTFGIGVALPALRVSLSPFNPLRPSRDRAAADGE